MGGRALTEGLVACCALWVCAATSRPSEPIEVDDPSTQDEPGVNEPEATELSATIVLHNALASDAVVRVRRLADAADLDCDAIAEQPGALLSETLLDTAQSWTIPAGDNLGIDGSGSRTCHAVWIEGDGLGARWLFWYQAQRSFQIYEPDVRPEGPGVVVVGGGSQGLSFEGPQDLLFAPEVAPRPSETCAPTQDGQRLTWSTPVPTGGTLVRAEHGADGCWSIVFADGDDDTTPWYLCMSQQAWPFEEGAVLEVETRYGTGNEGISIAEAGHPAAEGPTVVVSRGSDAPLRTDLSFEYMSDEACAFDVEPSCGVVSRVGSLRVSTPEGIERTLQRGTALEDLPATHDRTIRVEAHTIQQRIALHAECGAGPDVLGTDIELTITTR